MYIDRKTKYDPNYRTGNANTSNEPSEAYRILSMYNGRIEIRNEENGASFSITDSNLIYLMDHSIVENRTFKTKCVMAKEGTKTILLPEGSELYNTVMERMNRPNLKLSPGKVYSIELLDKEPKEMLYLGSFQDIYVLIPKEYRKVKSSGKIVFSRIPREIRGSYKSFYFLSIDNGEIVKITRRNSFVIVDKIYENLEGYETKESRFETVRDYCISTWGSNTSVLLPSTKTLYYGSSEEEKERFFEENNIKIK